MGSIQVNLLGWWRGHLLVSKLFFFFFPHWKRKSWLPVEAEIFRRTTLSVVGGWHLEKTRQAVPSFPVQLAEHRAACLSEQRETL